MMLLAGVVGGCGTSSPTTVSMFPMPGSHMATPGTQIAFRGIPLSQLGPVVVTGSRSGRHAGRMDADSDGHGGSFLPHRPFLAGETVTVRLHHRLVDGSGRTAHFTVATPAGGIPNTGLPAAGRVAGDVLAFHSRQDLSPASVELTHTSAASEGDVFLAPQRGPTQNGPMIIDGSGDLVWFNPLPKGDLATDFRVQHLDGKPVLTWWQGYVGAGVGVGADEILDSSYRQVAVVHAANGLSSDLHEFQLTDDGNALITSYFPVQWDAASVHGSKRTVVLDSVVQEIDIKTGLLLFDWDSLDHVPLTDTYAPLPSTAGHAFDYFHVNAIEPDGDQDLILSARNTWAGYKIDIRTGKTMWTLGGKRSSFKLSPAAKFAFQHDVRVRGSGDREVTVFDDGAGPPSVHQQSRGLTLKLDPTRRTATLAVVDRHQPALLANFEGNVQALSGGGRFVGWGQQPYFTQFDSHGSTVFDGRFIGANSSYRAFRFPWRGTPGRRPDVTTAATGNGLTVYASWNGATDVVAWQVLEGDTSTQLHPVARTAKTTFETAIAAPAARYVAVRALDAKGATLGTSLPRAAS